MFNTTYSETSNLPVRESSFSALLNRATTIALIGGCLGSGIDEDRS